jgi:hypothetical protein
MKLVKYNQFVGLNSINENLDKAKKFLKDRYLIRTAVEELKLLKGELGEKLKHGEIRSVTLNDFNDDEKNQIKNKIREISLTPENLRVIEGDPDLKKLRELKTEVVLPNGTQKTYQLDKDNMGWLGAFTYFYFFEEATFTDLSNIYRRLLENKDIIQNLTINKGSVDRPVLVKKAFDLNFIDTDSVNNMEKLSDGLDRLSQYRKVKKIADKLSISSELKQSYQTISEMNMDKFIEISERFDKLSDKDLDAFFGGITLDTFRFKLDKNGQVTTVANPLFNTYHFMSTLPRYHNIEEFLKAANQYLDSLELSKDEVIEGETEEEKRTRLVRRRFLDFCKKVDDCVLKFGTSGAEFVYPEKPEDRFNTNINKDGILIIEVKSFPANVMLNSHTNHCIKDNIGHWNSYVGNHNNKQYYIYDFNEPLTSDSSTFGITIQPGQSIRACHNRRDTSIGDNRIKDILKEYEEIYNINMDLWSLLKPMNKEEIDRRERSKVANRKITEKGISIEQIVKYVKEDGADINNENGKCLENAIEEDDIEKVESILKLGALTTLKKKEEGPLLKAKGIDMIKLLVTYGAEMNGRIFNNVISSVSALQFCLSAGLDPNFESSLPLRASYKGTWNQEKARKGDGGESYYDSFLLLMEYIKKTSYWKELLDGKGSQIIKWAADYGRTECLDYFKKEGLFDKISDSDMDDIFTWVKISRKRDKESKIQVVNWLIKNTGKKPSYDIEAIR